MLARRSKSLENVGTRGLYLKSKHGPDNNFRLIGDVTPDMNDTSRSTDEGSVRGHNNRQPFSLYAEAKMPTWKKLYAPTYPEREARKVVAGTSRQACRA